MDNQTEPQQHRVTCGQSNPAAQGHLWTIPLKPSTELFHFQTTFNPSSSGTPLPSLTGHTVVSYISSPSNKICAYRTFSTSKKIAQHYHFCHGLMDVLTPTIAHTHIFFLQHRQCKKIRFLMVKTNKRY